MAPKTKTHIKATDHWRSPPFILDKCRKVGNGTIYLDPCGQDGDYVDAIVRLRGPKYKEDGLKISWHGLTEGLVYVNPPYSRPNLELWTQKMAMEAVKGVEIISLLKSDHSTEWWNNNVLTANAICLLKKRVKHLPAPGLVTSSPNFPSAIVYWGENVEEFDYRFKRLGLCVHPKS